MELGAQPILARVPVLGEQQSLSGLSNNWTRGSCCRLPCPRGSSIPGRGPWQEGAALPIHSILITFPFYCSCQEPTPGSVLRNVYLRESHIGIKAGWFHPTGPSGSGGAEPASPPSPSSPCSPPFCGHLVHPGYAPWKDRATSALGVQA